MYTKLSGFMLRTLAWLAAAAVVVNAGCGHRAVNQPPIGFIDTPAEGAHLGRSFVTAGWALDDDRVASVSFFVDGEFLLPIEHRRPRADLIPVFPKLVKPGAQHGWSASVTLPPTVTTGIHALGVHLMDNAGVTTSLGPIHITLDPETPLNDVPTLKPTLAGELPLGFVDLPKPNEKVDGKVFVRGWALDDRGVREIRVFFDRTFLTSLTLTTFRADVNAAYPQFAVSGRPNGWEAVIIVPSTQAGPHTLLFQVVDTDSLTRVIGVVPIVVNQ